MRASKTLLLVLVGTTLLLGISLPLVAQDELVLTDGINGMLFFGAGSTHISMTIPSTYCTGGICTIAADTATGYGNLAGSGTYAVTTPAGTPVMGGFAGPFSLTVRSDGSSAINQTAPMNFNYTSTAGTLTGLLNCTNMSASDAHIHSIMTCTLSVTGGTYANFFPYGGNASITWGLTFPFQLLWRIHGFSTGEFLNGIIDPAAACQILALQNKEQWGLKIPHLYPTDLLENFTQTNNPTQITCTGTNPCGSIDVGLGSGSFSGDLVVNVQLSSGGADFQFDRMGFNSDITSGFSLSCFNFGNSCSSGTLNASLGGPQQEDGFGNFQNTLFTGLNGGSGCQNDGTGCQTQFTFVVGNSNGPLQTSDFDPFVAGHIANGTCSGYIATPSDPHHAL